MKRGFDVIASAIGLVLLWPLFLLIAIAIKLDSPGPIFFRQERVGRFGKIFRIHKFRTMVVARGGKSLQVTASTDPRITRVGEVLRRYKLDELAQLIDVLYGDMSLVGPRPEVPAYVNYYPEEAKRVISSVRPGITDRASIEFRSENEILARHSDVHKAYIEEILPIKVRYYLDYVESRTFFGDIRIIISTIYLVFRG